MSPQSRHTLITAAAMFVLSFASAHADPLKLDQRCRPHEFGTRSEYVEGCRAATAMLGQGGPKIDERETSRAVEIPENPVISPHALRELRKSRNNSL